MAVIAQIQVFSWSNELIFTCSFVFPLLPSILAFSTILGSSFCRRPMELVPWVVSPKEIRKQPWTRNINWTLNPEHKNKWRFHWLHQTLLNFLHYKEAVLAMIFCKKATALRSVRSYLRSPWKRKCTKNTHQFASDTTSEFPSLCFFPSIWPTEKNNSTVIQKCLRLIQVSQLWRKCLSHSVLLPPPFRFPTLPHTL